MPKPPNNASAPTLSRDLGVSHASAVVVGTIIGSGIFLVPAEMMQAVGSAWLVYLAWIVGGVLSLAGAITYAELGAMKPQAGGEYVYIRDAYGPLPGFLYAWTWFAIAKPASIATLTVGFVRILGTFPALAFFNLDAVRSPFAISYGQLVAIAAAALITGLNYIGIKRAGDFQVVFTLMKIAIIVAVAFMAFSAASGTWRNFQTSFLGARGGFAGFMAALVAALWAYDGWNDLNMVSGEIRDPGSTIPIALIAGVGMVAVLYMLTNAAVQYVLPGGEHRGIAAASVGGDGRRGGRLGSGHRLRRHGAVHAGRAERDHHERSACALRHGPRRLLLQGDGRRASRLPHAVGRPHRAVGAFRRSSAVRGELPTIVFAGHLRRVALLYDRDQHGIRAAPQGTKRSSSLPYLGISGCTRAVRRGRSRAAVLHLHRERTKLGVGDGGDPGGRTNLFILRGQERTTR